jgi:hypothetical protein
MDQYNRLLDVFNNDTVVNQTCDSLEPNDPIVNTNKESIKKEPSSASSSSAVFTNSSKTTTTNHIKQQKQLKEVEQNRQISNLPPSTNKENKSSKESIQKQKKKPNNQQKRYHEFQNRFEITQTHSENDLTPTSPSTATSSYANQTEEENEETGLSLNTSNEMNSSYTSNFIEMDEDRPEDLAQLQYNDNDIDEYKSESYHSSIYKTQKQQQQPNNLIKKRSKTIDYYKNGLHSDSTYSTYEQQDERLKQRNNYVKTVKKTTIKEFHPKKTTDKLTIYNDNTSFDHTIIDKNLKKYFLNF